MTSGGHEVDIGGEGPNCQNYTQDHPFEHITVVSDSRPLTTGAFSRNVGKLFCKLMQVGNR